MSDAYPPGWDNPWAMSGGSWKVATPSALVEHQRMTLTEFLLARIADDERDARIIESTSCHGVDSAAEAEILRLSDPARVLVEVEAKRRIVEMHAYSGDDCAGHPSPWTPHDDYGTGWCKRGDEDHWELRWLASAYAAHPDYREEWRP